jgi:hypothetical protein
LAAQTGRQILRDRYHRSNRERRPRRAAQESGWRMNASGLSDGAVTGAVRTWLKIEGLSALVLSVLVYAHSGSSWWMFLGLLLTPDLSMLPYFLNPRVGSICYNVVHSYFLPLTLASGAIAFNRAALLPYLCI